MQELVRAIDRDGDGHISFAEFTAYFRLPPDAEAGQAMPAWQQRLKAQMLRTFFTKKPVMRALFSLFDVSGSGFISVQHFEHALRVLIETDDGTLAISQVLTNTHCPRPHASLSCWGTHRLSRASGRSPFGAQGQIEALAQTLSDGEGRVAHDSFVKVCTNASLERTRASCNANGPLRVSNRTSMRRACG